MNYPVYGQQPQNQQQGDDYDPLADLNRAPALSFKGAPIGTTRRVFVTEATKKRQSRDFETGQPAYWDPDPVTGQRDPVMAVVVAGLDEQGQPISVWGTIPSAMTTALAAAQASSGARILPGSILDITFSSEKPNENPRLNAQKLYTVVHTPNGWTPPSKAPDPLGGQQVAQQPPTAQAVPQQPAQPQFQAPPQQPQFAQGGPVPQGAPAFAQAPQQPAAQPQFAPGGTVPPQQPSFQAPPPAQGFDPAAAQAATPQFGATQQQPGLDFTQPPFAQPQFPQGGSEQQPPY
jgi:hypothetical protein